MTDYDSMSVHELVMEIYYAGAEIKSDVRQMCEDALRRKVIEEASVGVVSIYMTPDCARHIKLSDGIKPGSYVVIPKETP